MSHPQSYEILLVPRFAADTRESEDTAEAEGTADTAEAAEPGGAVRSAVVSATGETGASGYPRYSGEGIVADIDPATHAVEALLVDGAELSFGLSARIRQRGAGAGADR